MARKRVLLGLGIIAGGVCAALPFRRETPPFIPAAKDAPAMLPIVATTPLAGPPTSLLSSPSPYLDDGSNPQAVEHSLLAGAPPGDVEKLPVAKAKSVEMPLLPVRFQIKQREQAPSQPWEPARIEAGIPPRPCQYRIHKLDTLEDLAERFLGSRERALEIFEANRDVLKSPQVLPLGAVIRIPGASSEMDAAGELLPARDK